MWDTRTKRTERMARKDHFTAVYAAPRTPTAAEPAEAALPPDPQDLPEWDLNDLYSAPDSAELKADLARAGEDAKAFAAKYQGKLSDLAAGGAAGEALAAAVQDYEQLQDLAGRISSYAGLRYAGDTSDPERSKFYGDMQEQITAVATNLLFFELELNRLDDDVLETAMASAGTRPLQTLARRSAQGEALSARGPRRAAVPRKDGDRQQCMEPSVRRDHERLAVRDRRRGTGDRADPQPAARSRAGKTAHGPPRPSPKRSRKTSAPSR